MLILNGANKGGVGKTFVARSLLDYDPLKKLSSKLVDTEDNIYSLTRFYPESKMIDVNKVDDLMLLLDNMPSYTFVDVKAGLLATILRELRDLGMMDMVAAKTIRLLVIHVIGPTISSLNEITETAEQMSEGGDRILVKNFISDSQFFNFQSKEIANYFAAFDAGSIINVPHLRGRAQEDVDMSGKTFRSYTADPNGSTVLKGLVTKWLRDTHAEFDRVKLPQRLV